MKNIDRAKTALFYIVIAIIIGILMASCSSSKKIKESSYKKVDSTGTSISQSSGIRSSDSNHIKTSEQSNSEEITLDFADESSDSSGTDAVEKATDLAGTNTIVKKQSGIHKVNIGGKEISSSRPIKSLTLKTGGKATLIDLTQVAKKDSGQQSDQTTATISKVEKEKKKDVEKHGASPFIWIIGGLGTLAILIVAYRFGFLDKRKNTAV
jgi:hypothetical protein